MKMTIYIPTKGRVGSQLTMRSLPKALHRYTVIVCPKEEAEYHKRNWNGARVLAQPKGMKNIAEKRAWIISTHMKREKNKKLIMLDDDLNISAPVKGNPKQITKGAATEAVIINAFAKLYKMLDSYHHGGFAVRQNANSYAHLGVRYDVRVTYALAYRVDTMVKECELGRIQCREDMDYTLQLLKKGYSNFVIYDIVVDQRAFGAKGGCTDERSMERSNSEADKLAKLHPGLVEVVEKDYGVSIPRKEVIVQWKKSLGANRNDRN